MEAVGVGERAGIGCLVNDEPDREDREHGCGEDEAAAVHSPVLKEGSRNGPEAAMTVEPVDALFGKHSSTGLTSVASRFGGTVTDRC